MHAVVGGQQDRGIGRGRGEFAQQGIELCEVLPRLLGLGRPHMHRVIRGVYVEDADFRLMAQDPRAAFSSQ